MQQLVVWMLDSQHYALPLNAVERVLLAVQVTPLPDAPPGVLGLIDVAGQLTPVFDMRQRLHRAPRPLRLSDRLVLARANGEPVAFFADDVAGVIEHDGAVEALTYGTAADGAIAGAVKLPGDIILIHDLERFLAPADAQRLRLALAAAA